MSPITLRRIRGHSMMPVLPPHTLIWGFKWYNRLKVGNIVIFQLDGKERIRRISEIRDDEIYLLGDHSEASKDSRQFGWLSTDQVIAKVIWPRAPKHRAENS